MKHECHYCGYKSILPIDVCPKCERSNQFRQCLKCHEWYEPWFDYCPHCGTSKDFRFPIARQE